MSDNKFVPGLLVKAPRDGAPEYVKAKISIKVAELQEFLRQQDGEWVNLDVKVSQGGKWYAAIDDWKPNGGSSARQGGQQQRQRPQQQAPVDDFDDENIPC